MSDVPIACKPLEQLPLCNIQGAVIVRAPRRVSHNGRHYCDEGACLPRTRRGMYNDGAEALAAPDGPARDGRGAGAGGSYGDSESLPAAPCGSDGADAAPELRRTRSPREG